MSGQRTGPGPAGGGAADAAGSGSAAATPEGAPVAPILVVMGVSGVGKSTIAEALAARLHWPFQEGDLLHPPANVEKMHAGIPLTDADRAPWLAAIAAWMDERIRAGEPGIVTCSALKRRYRDQLREGRPQVRFLYLRADPEVIAARLSHRHGHFMPPSMLASQLATLEEPSPAEHPITVDVDGTPEQVVERAVAALREAGLVRTR